MTANVASRMGKGLSWSVPEVALGGASSLECLLTAGRSRYVVLGVLAVVLLLLGAILGRSDLDVEPVAEPIGDILDELDEDDEPAQVQPRVQPVGRAPEDTTLPVGGVSGPQGIAYSGRYGTIQGGMVSIDGLLGAGPAEYGVETGGGAFGTVSAVFQETQPVPGPLRAEALSGGGAVAEGATSEESSWVVVKWSPQGYSPQ